MKPDIKIIYEDEGCIVIYKPAGLSVQTARASEEDVCSKLKNHLKGGYLGVIHRLDQPVEGVMVFAKTSEAANKLTKQITDHIFSKKYYAIISRESFPDEGELVDYLVKDNRTNLSKVVKESDPRAKKAILRYRAVDHWDDKKLLDIDLFTGRHHQIRIQLASRTAPIVGDVKYGGISTGHNLALCSYHIGFNHPVTGERMGFDIKPKGADFADSKVAG